MYKCTVTTETYQSAKIKASIEHILQLHFLLWANATTFPGLFRLQQVIQLISCSSIIADIFFFFFKRGLFIIDCWHLRQVQHTGKQYFLHVYWSCHWTKHFLRLCLPVVLQQNLRCKVWDDTAKIRYSRTVCHQWTMQVVCRINSLSQCLLGSVITLKLVRST